MEIYLPVDYTNGVNIQKITGMSLGNISGGKYRKKIITDKYGNKKLNIKFFNLKKEIFLDYGFVFSSQVKPRRNKFTSSYPMNPKTLTKYYKYLRFTNKVQYGHKAVLDLVNKLRVRYNGLYKVVLSVLMWVSKNIIHDPNTSYDDGLTTYLNRRGNESGLLNLTLMLLRTARIPCRVVKGISINKKYVYMFNGNNIEFRYPRGYYKWIEVFFPTRAWVPFDIFASFFFVPDNIIRLGVGSDTKEVEDVQKLSNGIYLKSTNNFFIESMNFIKYIQNSNISSNSYQNIILPPGNEGMFLDRLIKKQGKENLFIGKYLAHKKSESYPVLIYSANIKQPASYNTLIKTKITSKTSYAQAFDLKRAFFLDHVAVPIYFSGIYPAKVRVEVFSDKDGRPGELYARSYYKILRESKKGLNINKFYFNRNRWPFLKTGRYWIILRVSDKGQIYWRGIFGNIFAGTYDTRKDDTQNWGTVCSTDLMFELWGNYKNRPEK